MDNLALDAISMLQNLSPGQRRALAVLVVGGGITGTRKVTGMVKQAQEEQRQIWNDLHSKSSTGRKGGKIAVDGKFFKRLMVILSICVPSVFSKEAGLVLIQGILLVSRTLLTDWIAAVEGHCGRAIISQDFGTFGRGVAGFAVLGAPAAVVNSALKYMQKQLELAFQEKLTVYLHRQYCSNRAYYAASTLGGLMNADQRITEDVEKFSAAVSDLYAHTLKPLLDVILFTRSLAKVMGYKGQFGLYAYYIGVAYFLRMISPPLAQMSAAESALSGSFRAAHQRLVTHSEEVAFNDPPAGAAEQMILNQHLRRLVRYSGLSAFQRFIQQIFDGYFVKYISTVVALLVYAGPIYYKDPALRGTQGEIAQDYIRAMRLLQNTARGVGDLILVYKRVCGLASHTSRVAELLEQVMKLSREDAEHRELFRRNVSHTLLPGLDKSVHGSGEPPAPRRLHGSTIRFHRMALDAPDGVPLIRELSFEVLPGCSVMLMGPNGCGKSSLFRVLAGLWPLQGGEVQTPSKSQLFYLSQRPYLVSGCLRDQLLYPHPPRAVWQAATPRERIHYQAVNDRPEVEVSHDADLERCLRAVELEYLLGRGCGWDQVQNWNETLSGGEKQRLAMARLLFHRPTYAILDECTSAVSADGELKLYQECRAAGITFLSIAHRPALKRFHSLVIHFDGNVAKTGKGWWMEELSHSEPDLRAESAPALMRSGAADSPAAGAAADV